MTEKGWRSVSVSLSAAKNLFPQMFARAGMKGLQVQGEGARGKARRASAALTDRISTEKMLDKVVYPSNVAALAAAMEALAERSPSQPGVVLVYGDTGFGKTIGTRHLAVRDDALFITAMPFWSPHAMLSKRRHELTQARRPRTAAMFD